MPQALLFFNVHEVILQLGGHEDEKSLWFLIETVPRVDHDSDSACGWRPLSLLMFLSLMFSSLKGQRFNQHSSSSSWWRWFILTRVNTSVSIGMRVKNSVIPPTPDQVCAWNFKSFKKNDPIEPMRALPARSKDQQRDGTPDLCPESPAETSRRSWNSSVLLGVRLDQKWIWKLNVSDLQLSFTAGSFWIGRTEPNGLKKSGPGFDSSLFAWFPDSLFCNECTEWNLKPKRHRSSGNKAEKSF